MVCDGPSSLDSGLMLPDYLGARAVLLLYPAVQHGLWAPIANDVQMPIAGCGNVAAH